MKNKYCNIKMKDGKKKPNFGKKWGAMSKSDANASFVQTGDGMYVIDIDSKKIPKKYKKWVQSLGDPTVETARGYHYYVKSDFKMKNHTDIFNDSKFKVDIRGEGGLVFTDYWGKDKGISYVKSGKRLKDKKFKITGLLPDHIVTGNKGKGMKKSNGQSNITKSELKKILKKLDPDMSYDKWNKVGMALHTWNSKKGLKLFDKWSSKGKSYDGSTKKKWRNYDHTNRGEVTVGSLIHMAHGERCEPADIFPNDGKELKIITKKKRKKKLKKKKAKGVEGLLKGLWMTDADYAAVDAQKYLLDGFIPDGGFGIFAGKEGSGKSWMTFYLANLLLEKHEDKKVLFFDIDSGAVYTKVRSQHLMDKFGDRFKFFSQHKAGVNAIDMKEHFTDMADLDLREYIIIIDSLVGMTLGKLNGSEDVKPILNIMEGLRNAGATVILIHHNRKDGGYAGSFSIAGSLDFMYAVSKNETKITLDLTKERGKYENHTVEITDFERCEGVEVGYISGDEFKAEEERKEREENQEHKDADYIKQVRTALKELKGMKRTLNKQMLCNYINTEFGTNHKTVKKLLNRYDGVHWESKVKKKKGVTGRPGITYKLIKIKSKE